MHDIRHGRPITSRPHGLPDMVFNGEKRTIDRAPMGSPPDPWLTVSAWMWLAYFALLAGVLGWLL